MRTLLPLLLLTMSLAANGQPQPSELNTAADMVAEGMADGHWQVATGDSLQPLTPFVPAKVVGNCDALWFGSGTPAANWIAYDQGSGCYHVGLHLDFYFRRRVILPPTNACGRPIGEVFCFEMDMNGDNCIRRVLVNGVPNYDHAGSPTQCDNLQNTVTAQLCEGWQPGENFLTVHVSSTPPAAGFLAVARQRQQVPSGFLGNDTSLCSATSFTINSTSDQTRWFDNTEGKSKTVESTGLYWAEQLDAGGCEVRDTVLVSFSTGFYVPNVFSSNGDGLNDTFAPFFADVPPSDGYLLQVFDRWGSLVFQTQQPAEAWDGNQRGKPCSAGIYAYLIMAGAGGCTTTSSGGVLLVR